MFYLRLLAAVFRFLKCHTPRSRNANPHCLSGRILKEIFSLRMNPHSAGWKIVDRVEIAICYPYLKCCIIFVIGLMSPPSSVRSIPELCAGTLNVICVLSDRCMIRFKIILRNQICMPKVKEHAKKSRHNIENNIFCWSHWTRGKLWCCAGLP